MSGTTPADLDALSATDITVPIPADVLAPVLSSPPFIPIPTLINARDVGAAPGSAIPEGRIYRCALLSGAGEDPAAAAWLAGHVARIFDLRGSAERLTSPEPVFPGVESDWYDTEGDYREAEVSQFIEDSGAAGWRLQLMSIVHVYKPTFREVLKHVRDRPNDPFLFHCTAGRDRTGAMAGMLQYLAGTAPEDTLRDYMLSRIGTEPARDMLLEQVLKLQNMTDINVPGFVDMVSLRPTYWTAFLEDLQKEYGGWDGYVTKGLGFSQEDLEKIKKNLRS